MKCPVTQQSCNDLYCGNFKGCRLEVAHEMMGVVYEQAEATVDDDDPQEHDRLVTLYRKARLVFPIALAPRKAAQRRTLCIPYILFAVAVACVGGIYLLAGIFGVG